MTSAPEHPNAMFRPRDHDAFAVDIRRQLHDVAKAIDVMDPIRSGGERVDLTTRFVSIIRHPLISGLQDPQIERLLSNAYALDARAAGATIAFALDRKEFVELHQAPLAATADQVIDSYEQRLAKLVRWRDPLPDTPSVDVQAW